jgi:WD40 repeat protein
MHLRYVALALVVLTPPVFARPGEPPLEVVVQTGHTDQVRQAAVSGDGKYFVTVGATAAILWEATSGKMLRTFGSNGSTVQRVALSGDGSRLVTGLATDRGTFVALWDTATGKQLQTFRGHRGYISSVSISHDGTLLTSTGSSDGTAIVWKADGSKVRTLESRASCARLSGDGKQLLTCGDRKVILWEAATGKQLQTFEPKKGNEAEHAFLASDGKYVVTTTIVGNRATVWEAATGKELQTLQPPRSFISGIAVNGNRVVTGLKDTTIVWEAETGKQLHSLQSPKAEVMSVALSGDGRYLVTGFKEGRVLCWDTTTGKALHELPRVLFAAPATMALSDNGQRLLVSSLDNTALLWDGKSGKPIQTFRGSDSFLGIALNSDGSRAITGILGVATLWDASRSDKVRDLSPPLPEHSLAITKDSKLVLAAPKGGKTATLWETDGAKKLQTFEAPEEIYSAAISADGKYLATAALGKTAILWDAATGQKLKTFTAQYRDPITRMALTDDGKFLATFVDGVSNHVLLWDTATGKELGAPMPNNLTTSSEDLSKDGKQVALGQSRGKAFFWDVTNTKMQEFQGHEGWVWAVKLTADVKRLWTSSSDGTTRLWDVGTGKELCRLYSFNAGKDWLVVTPDGLFDGSEGGQALVTWRPPGTSKLTEDEATRRRMHRPRLLARVWHGEAP